MARATAAPRCAGHRAWGPIGGRGAANGRPPVPRVPGLQHAVTCARDLLGIFLMPSTSCPCALICIAQAKTGTLGASVVCGAAHLSAVSPVGRWATGVAACAYLGIDHPGPRSQQGHLKRRL